MADNEVKNKLIQELEAMGFPLAIATQALQYSGNGSFETAVNWIIDHGNEIDIGQIPLGTVEINVEDPGPADITEEVKIKAQELRCLTHEKKEEDKQSRIESEKERMQTAEEFLESKQIAEKNKRERILALRKAEKEEISRARRKILEKLKADKAVRRGNLGSHQGNPASIEPATHEHRQKLQSSLPVNITTKELMRDCLRTLKQNYKDDDRRVTRAFQTLLVYIRNVTQNPNVEKFRKIRLGNQAFRNRVGSLKGGVEFLELCGFERTEGGDFLILRRGKIDMEVLKTAASVLNSAITNPFFGLLHKTTDEYIVDLGQ